MPESLRSYLALFRAETQRRDGKVPHSTPPPNLPFISIARQAGAGGSTLAKALEQRLNRDQKAEPPWAMYDRALVKRIAEEHNLPERMVQNMEDSTHDWFQVVLEGLSFGDPSAMKIARRTMKTVRAVAEHGHTIILGRGGAFATRDMPQGIHIYLIAPLDVRVPQYARRMGLSQEEAARKIAEIDHNREVFYQRYFPRQRLSPESFHLTINTGLTSIERAVEAVATLVPVVSLAREPTPLVG